MTSMHTTLRRGALGAVAALALAAPTALAATASDVPQPPSAHVVETGVAAGQTEHGSFVSTNVLDAHWPFYRRVEYWATADRWMATAKDRAGRLIDEQLGGPEGWTTYTGPTLHRDAYGQLVTPSVATTVNHQLPPFPGYGAPGNAEAIANGWLRPLAGAPPRTIAGFTGTVYRQDVRRSHPGEVDTVVVQDGTLQPLLRENRIAHPKHGRPIDFQDRLLARETVPSAQARVQLTAATYAQTVRRWRAAVRAYKARHKARKKPHRAAPKHATVPAATPSTSPSGY